MIDWSRVRELLDEVGSDDFEEVVRLFLAEVEGIVTGLQSNQGQQPGQIAAGQGPDAASVGDTITPLEAQLHYLRGSALCLGFTSFCRICLEVEQKAARGRATAEHVSEVLFAYFGAKAELLGGLSGVLATETAGDMPGSAIRS
ncbi:Hpt domain-containing protein [Marinibacterium profundimaris]|uniref:Hpt domain-containing protein n=1 Tax=Marinibacterium profundimaris TaxID=1679460 RepID=UPI000B5239B6|nr:Hpt domain-containing protein [Marinibacterium profundimaris]